MKQFIKYALPLMVVILSNSLVSTALADCWGGTITVHNNSPKTSIVITDIIEEDDTYALSGPKTPVTLAAGQKQTWTVATGKDYKGKFMIKAAENDAKEGSGQYEFSQYEFSTPSCNVKSSNRDSDQLNITDENNDKAKTLNFNVTDK